MQPIECNGLWWLPDNEGDRVGGTLRVSGNGELRLSLMGALGTPSIGFLPATKDHEIILGSVAKSPNGHNVTLTGSFLIESSAGGFFGPHESYHSHLAYFGAHLPQKSDFTFKHLVLELEGLTEWAAPLSGFDRPVPLTHKTGEATSLGSYTKKEPARTSLPDGDSVALIMSLAARWGLQEYEYREHAHFEVECASAKSAHSLSGAYVYPLQNLLTFVSERPQKVERFSVWRTDDFRDFAANPEIRIIGPRVQPEEDETPRKRSRSFEMLFTIADADYSETVSKWFHVASAYVDACNIFFGLQYAPPAFVDLKFLGVLQALQLYFARREDGIALCEREAKRVREIIASLPTADAEWVVDRVGIKPHVQLRDVLNSLIDEHNAVLGPLVSSRYDRFISEVINTEYHVAKRDPELREIALHGASLYWMTEKLRILFSACFLRELGFPRDKVAAAFKRNPTYQHIRQLEAARESSTAESKS